MDTELIGEFITLFTVEVTEAEIASHSGRETAVRIWFNGIPAVPGSNSNDCIFWSKKRTVK